MDDETLLAAIRIAFYVQRDREEYRRDMLPSYLLGEAKVRLLADAVIELFIRDHAHNDLFYTVEEIYRQQNKKKTRKTRATDVPEISERT